MRSELRQLVDELRSNKCSIRLNDAGNIHLIPEDNIQLPEELIARVKENKPGLIEYLRSSSQKADLKIERTAVQESYPISNAQRRLWVLCQFEGASAAYHLSGNTYLNRDINIASFKKAIDATIGRHEILRTVFKEDEANELRQWILTKEELGFKIDYRDLRKERDKDEKVQAYIAEDAHKIFDLANGPLLRAALLQLEDEAYMFYYTMHHIISDGWSMDVLTRDVLAHYEAYKEGREPVLGGLRIQYKDYSAWQLAQQDGEAFQAHRKYWLNNLQGELPLLDLPGIKQRPAIKTSNGRMLGTYLNKPLTQKLKKYSETKGGSLFMGLLASWNVLMYRYSGQDDLVIGSSTAGREHADLEDQIGFYVNTLALRTQVRAEESFDELFARVRQSTLEAYAHQMYPFDRLVEDLELRRDTSRSAVFDTMLALQNNGEKQAFDPAALGLKEEELDRIADKGAAKSKFDLSVSVQEQGDYLSFLAEYNTDVYEGEMISRLLDHYKRLLSNILADPKQPVGDIGYLSQEEKHELLVTLNDTYAPYPQDQTIAALFEQQAKKTPDNIAAVFENKMLSYHELHERSNRLAWHLREHYGIATGDLVGIQLQRSEWLIIALLGVLKAGAAFVPIDPEYPASRKEHILKDASIRLLITETTFLTDLDHYKGDVFTIDAKFGTLDGNSLSLEIPVTSSDLAYVIYTSGSTGNPKGVMVEHRALVNLCSWHNNRFSITADDRATLYAGLAFDASVWELFPYLIRGACVYVVPQKMRLDNQALTTFFEENNITVAFLPTPIAEQFMDVENGSLRYLLTGGDKLNRFKKKNYELVNNYGPTENTVVTTSFRVEALDLNIPIGSPIANNQVYIVNEQIQLVPKGVKGEICIGGSGLARGYLNNEALTHQKFIPNPFKEGERLYRTGDLGRWLPGGTIEFMGRKDEQVKIRGYRIEPGEIEHALLSHGQIKEALVLAKENSNHERELVAYITATEVQNINALRLYLKEILPGHMLPAHYVQLEALPLTQNGKVDRRALPDPLGFGLKSGVEYVAPGTEEEKVLVSVWGDVLKRDTIGIKDSFYNLGGDSIKSIQVVSRLKQQGYTLKVEHILRTPVLEELALLLQKSTRLSDQSEVTGKVELTPIQEWFFEGDEIKAPAHFNQSVLLKSKEALDTAILEKSIADLVRHHDALRMRYKRTEEGWEQINQDAGHKGYSIDFYDLGDKDNAQELMADLGDRLQAGMDLAAGALFKVVHFKLNDGCRLGLILHHLVVDGVSWRNLLEDLQLLYTGYKAGKKTVLPQKTDSFQRWARLQKEYAEGAKIKKERAYWEELTGRQIDGLPQDQQIREHQAAELDGSVFFNLDKNTTEILQTRVHQVYNTEINDLLLTGLGLALKEVLSSEQAVLKMEGHGREDIIEGVDISRTVGWFTTVYPFVLDTSKTSAPTEALVKIKEDLRKIPNKGIGYGILSYLSQEKLRSRLVPEVVFNYLGDFGMNAGGSPGEALFEYAPESIGTSSAKENENRAVLDVSGMIVRGELNMSLRYSRSRYNVSTLEKLARSYEKNLKALIKELSTSQETYLTPSDLSYKGLSPEELSKINADGSVEDIYELSPMQEGIYYHWLSDEPGSLYFEQMAYRVNAKGLKIEKLKRAYDRLIARHSILRTGFTNKYGGRSLQIVRKTIPDHFMYENIAGKEDAQNYLESVKQKDMEMGFDLEGPSQMRFRVIELSEGLYEFIWSHHHILMDGWCMSILVDDFGQLLSAEILGTKPDLPPVIPYSNYIHWLNKVDRNGSMTYWKNYLAGYSQRADIPFKITAKDTGYSEFREHLRVEGDLFQQLDRLCNQIGITPNVFIQGVWGYLLSRYNSTQDVVFGAVVSGRPAELQGVENMVGLFVNTIPVRVSYKPGQTPADLLKVLQEQSIQSISHHYVNLSDIQSQSEPGSGLISHIVAFQNYAVKKIQDEGVINTQREEGLFIESPGSIVEQTNYDFNIIVGPAPDALNIHIKYDRNRYDDLSMKRLKAHFENLIRVFAEHPDEPLNTIHYLSGTEQQEMLSILATGIDYPKEKNIVDLFVEQVKVHRQRTALVFDKTSYSYEELNHRSNQVAHFLLKEAQIEKEEKVGLLLIPGLDMVSAMLGILKAGGAYVPLDAGLPEERLSFMVSDVGMRVLITQKEFIETANRLQWGIESFQQYLCIDSEDVRAETEQQENVMMSQELWDHVGERAKDQITGGGWLSSYTGKAIPDVEMEEYSLNAYKKLQPSLHKDMRVLEIGCSSGLTLSKVAPEVGFYYGTDLSPVIISNTEKLIAEKSLTNVKLKQLVAHEISQLEEKDFDLVIINSVIQHFHGHNYLLKVIRDSVALLKEEGRIFIGDIMDLNKKEALVADLEAFKRQNQDQGYTTKTDFSSDLFVARGYFEDLIIDEKGIIGVEISEKIHTIENELTKFRYDAVLRIDKKQAKKKKTIKHKYQYSKTSLDSQSQTGPKVKITPDQLAYIIYTSGTTGRPKGVMVDHYNVVRLFKNDAALYDFSEKDTWTMFHSYAFDFSVWEMYGALLFGGKLVLVPKLVAQDTSLYLELLEKESVTVLNQTPSAFYNLSREDEAKGKSNLQVRYVIFGGEALSPGRLTHWSKRYPDCKLINMYGITETTVHTTYKEISQEEITQNRSNIGKAIPTVSCLVLDENKRLVPVGVTGELYVGGAGVARGYLNRAELTKERFIAHPYLKGERLYRSGDKVRQLMNGDLEYLGRVDDQVKIRGYRIELGEIEHALLKHAQVEKAVVLAKENQNNEKELVAYITARSEQNTSDLRAYLKEFLAEYMLPSHFVQLAELPLTPNGKIDKKALPDPEGLGLASGIDYVAPRNGTEEKLVAIWEGILQKKNIGIKDDFFVLGGNSIKAMKLISAVQHALDHKIEIRQIFANPTIENISLGIENMQWLSENKDKKELQKIII